MERKIALGAAVAIGAYAGLRILDNQLMLGTDLFYLTKLAPALVQLKKYQKEGYSIGQYWEDSVVRHRTRVSLKFQDRQWTFEELDQEINKFANWALSKGFKQGDVVSLYMENCPEFIIAWFGFAKLGIVVAMINYNLRLKGLLHCITVSKSKAVVSGPNISEALGEIQGDLEKDQIEVFTFGPGNSAFGTNINEFVASQPKNAPSKDHRKGILFTDTFTYIYTSGTTGLPKAAIMTHQRFFMNGKTFSATVAPDDVVYCVLPLYHSSACLGLSAMISSGLCFAISRKFSVTNFWKEATEYKATVMQYIGELCRYLLNAPPGKYDRAHKIRIAIGNGLRPDIWGPFQERFNIPVIGEFYGSTEGNASLSNYCDRPEYRGAVGRVGYIGRKLLGFKIVKFDVEKEEIIRGKDGFCIECKPGEAGEFIGVIKDSEPLTQFKGYTDPEATKKKILTDVFVKGDKYARTGDLLMKDSRGLFYFIDRIGDTFRWKGENVSTTEVAQIISLFPGVVEANIYGVQIPGADGRACMAGLIYKDNFDFKKFYKYCSENLPSYAVPLFIRKLEQIDITGTFKHQKVTLRKEGIDLSVVKDAIFWLNPSTKNYEPFTQDSLDLVKSGKSKL